MTILCVGDSKTVGYPYSGSVVSYDGPNNTFGFGPSLATDMDGAQIDTIALNGATVAVTKLTFDANLAKTTRSAGTRRVLFNFGAGEALAMPTEAQFESDYEYLIDAVHTKWPGAKVYLMTPWRADASANCDTLAAWIAVVVAARSSFVFAGPDERIFLKGSDNGATYMSDGIHPNTAGYALTAAQWQSAMGY